MSFLQWKETVKDKRFLCSWSGGKDSCLALHRAAQIGRPVKLLSMFDETALRSRSHGLTQALVSMQAEALALPLETRSATWGQYEAEFIGALGKIKQDGAETAVFGDIDLEPHGLWEKKVCDAAGLDVCLPLWKGNRRELYEEFVGLGYRAVIVTVNEAMLHPRFLGRELTLELMLELEGEGIDVCGENGEYHTAMLDGPLFRHSVKAVPGEIRSHEGYSFLSLQV